MAPTLITSYPVVQSANNATTLTTPAFTPAVGEILVVKGVTADSAIVIGAASGGGLTYTSRATVTTASKAPARIFTAPVVTSPGSMTVSLPFSGGTGWHSMLVERWSGAQVAASPAVLQTTQAAGTAPSATVTTVAANSVVSWAIGDWSAISPATRAYRSSAVEESIHDGSTSNYVAYYAYQAAAVAGTQTIGLTSPTQNPSIVGIEIQDSVAGSAGLTVRAASGFQSGAATTTPIAITLPTGTTTNDLVYIIVSMNSVLATLTQSAGTGTYTNRSPGGANGDRNSTGGHTSWLFSRTIVAGDTAPSFTIGGTSGKYSWTAVTIAPGAAGPLAVHSSLVGPTVESASGTSHTPPTLNAGVQTGLSLLANAWRAAGNAATAVTTAPPTNWVEPTNGDFSTAVGTTAALRQVAVEVSARTAQTGTITPGAQVTTSVAAFGNEYHVFAIEQTQFSQTKTDPIGLLDNTTPVTDYSRTLTDPVGILDTEIVGIDYTQTVADLVGLLDTPAQDFIAAATRAPVWVVRPNTDQAYRLRANPPQAFITSSPVEIAPLEQTLTDLIGLTDAVTQVAAHSRTLTDPVGLIDNAAPVATHTRSLTDLIGLTDAQTGVQVAARGQTDLVGLLDTPAQAAAASQTLTDPIGLTDPGSSALTAAQTVTDAVGLLDAAGQAAAASQTLTDAVGLLDVAGQSSSTARTLTDPVGLLDGVGQSSAGVLAQTLTDAIGLTDPGTSALTASQTVTDAIGLTDLGTTSATSARGLTDPVGLADTATQAASTAHTVGDVIGLTDVAQTSEAAVLTVTITDAVELLDSGTTAADWARPLSDSIGLLDGVSSQPRIEVTLTDVVGLTDVTAQAAGLLRTLLDEVGLDDRLQLTGTGVVPIVLPIGTSSPVDLIPRSEPGQPTDLITRGEPGAPTNRVTRARTESR